MPFTPILYVNENADSEEAKKVLRDAGIPFNELPDNTSPKEWEDDDDKVPRILTEHGLFPGMKNIQWYAKVYANQYDNTDSD